jgi:hypothetical protein
VIAAAMPPRTFRSCSSGAETGAPTDTSATRARKRSSTCSSEPRVARGRDAFTPVQPARRPTRSSCSFRLAVWRRGGTARRGSRRPQNAAVCDPTYTALAGAHRLSTRGHPAPGLKKGPWGLAPILERRRGDVRDGWCPGWRRADTHRHASSVVPQDGVRSRHRGEGCADALAIRVSP